jgi:tetratricopeptide (TPR) repeat protein
MRRNLLFAFVALPALLWAQERPPLFEGIGKHEFKVTTTSPEAQDYFNQGLVFSYGFNLDEAHRAFVYASALDPECAMAYWGAAYTLGPYLNGRMNPRDEEKARDLAAKALAKLDDETEVERALVQALQKRYEAGVARDQADKNYAEAMRAVAAKLPQESEVLTLAAEAMMDLHPWNFWTREKVAQEWTKEITELLDRSFEIDPDNPGTCHFVVHMWEGSATPEHAVPAADRLGSLSPGVEHLVHMPAHIYYKVGRYHDGTELNVKATRAHEEYKRQCGEMGLSPVGGYEGHDWDYVWAGATYEGRSELALKAAEREGVHDTKLAYSRIRFGKWEDLLKMKPADTEGSGQKAAMHYGRALAQLRLNGDVGAAQAEYDAMMVVIGENTRSNHYRISRDIVAGEIAAAKKDWDEAVRLLEEAKKVEDSMFNPELPSWHQPVRLILGKVLLDAGRAAEAETAYRECLRTFPDLGWALFGLVQALDAQGKDASAERARFEKAWQHADVKLTSSRF